jgi:hypothetical protein
MISIVAACTRRPSTPSPQVVAASDSAAYPVRQCAVAVLEGTAFEIRGPTDAPVFVAERRGEVLSVQPPSQAIDRLTVSFERADSAAAVRVRATPASYVLHGYDYSQRAYLTPNAAPSADARSAAQNVESVCNTSNEK